MEIAEIAGPLAGVLLGAVIASATSVLKARAERKRIIAKALSDLLEVRHHVVGIELILSHARDQLKIPRHVFPAIREAIGSIFALDPDIHERYDEAVNLLAGVDPLLAFYLRQKTVVHDLFGELRKVALDNGAPLEAMEVFEQRLSSMAVPKLNDAACTLARSHSVLTWWRVRRLIQISDEIPAEILEWFDTVKAQVEMTQAAPVQAAARPV